MSPIHHHFQKKGIHESKIVNRFLIIGVLLSVLAILTLKIKMKGLIAILGSGESGRGAAILAKKLGYMVFVSDSNKIAKQTKSLFKKLSIDYEENITR